MHLSDEVAAALAESRPIVALESTIISHGLPRPRNLDAAREFESILRDRGVTPATIAVLDGVPRIGLDDAGVRRIAEEELAKASVRDLPILAARGGSGATTVAATAHLASLAGIRVFATGGLGGVHRGAAGSSETAATFDESADLTTLGVTPITVVSAGVKSVLDIGATLERLETLSVAVVGYGTSRFPAFWLRESAFELDWRVDGPGEVAAIMAARDELGSREGIIVANPIAAGRAVGSGRARPGSRGGVRRGGRGGRARQGGHAVPAVVHRGCVGRPQPRGQPRSGPQQRPGRRRHRDRLVRTGAGTVSGERIVVVGDVINDVVVVPRGEIRPDTDTASTIRQRPGGSAANTAAWLGSVGAAVDFVGCVGLDDLADHERVFREGGVVPHLQLGTGLPTGTIVILVDGERRTMLTERGANSALASSSVTDALLAKAGVLHISGYSILDGFGIPGARDLITRATAAGAAVSVTPGSFGYLHDFGVEPFLEAIDGTTIVFPNLAGGPHAERAGGAEPHRRRAARAFRGRRADHGRPRASSSTRARSTPRSRRRRSSTSSTRRAPATRSRRGS